MQGNSFNPEIGQLDIQNKILKVIEAGRFPHALLLYGNEGVGKDAFAIELAKLFNCEKGPLFLCQNCGPCKKISHMQHPDVQFIFPLPAKSNIKPEEIQEMLQEKAQNPFKRTHFSGKATSISIDTVRSLKSEAKFKLYEGKKKVFIISEADEMRAEAANALLKILEEPPSNLLLILTTSRIYKILPTIRSRCHLIHFPALNGDEILRIIHKYIPDPPEHLAQITRLSLANLKLAFDFIQDDVLEKRDVAIDFLRKIVVIEKSNELLKKIDTITRSRDRREMKLLLYFLLVWFRDILHFKLTDGSSNDIINGDLKKNISGFLKGYPRADYPQIIRKTEAAIAELEDPRNLNPTLIFTNLSIKLNNLIKMV